MDTPFFSIVIPTRNRGAELYYTLKTCLEQDFSSYGDASYEIVVSDNDSRDDIRAVVERHGSNRIRYLRSDRSLSMTDSWEFALSHARGRYVGFVCTDDGYLLNTLSMVHEIVQRTGAEAVTFPGAYYYWPTCNDSELKDKLFIPRFIFREGIESSRRLIEESLNTLYYGRLPCFLNSFCSADLIARVRRRTGRIFHSFCPDVYSGFLMGASVAEIYVSNRLMLVGGVSGASTGSNAYLDPKGATFQEHVDLMGNESITSGLVNYPFVATLIVDSAAKALSAGGQAETIAKLNPMQYLAACYRQALTLNDPVQRRKAIAAIMQYVRERPERAWRTCCWLALKRGQWALQKYVPLPLLRLLQQIFYRPDRSSGGLANDIVLAREHNITNVYDAALYVTQASRH